MCKAEHGGTRVPRRVSTDLGRFKEPLAQGWLTRVAATGTPRGTWSRDQRGQKRPSRWCSGGYRLARRGPSEEGTDGDFRMDHPPPPRLFGPQGASHERGGAASRGAERAALLRDPDSAGEDLPRTPQKTPTGKTPGPSRPISPRPRTPPGEPRPPQSAPPPSPRPPLPGEPPGRGPRRGVPLRRSAGRGAHARRRVPGLRRAAPGRPGAARVSEVW